MSAPAPCEALIAARNTAGLSQQALADRAGLSKSTVLRVEKGEKRPGVDVALALARELDTTVEQLFGQATS